MNIKELAEQAGAKLYADTIIVNGKDADDFVKRFAELVAAAEREACAKVAEAEPKVWRTDAPTPQQRIAAAIRARGDKHD